MSMGRCDLTAHMGQNAEGGLSAAGFGGLLAGRPRKTQDKP
jgi:hypothetical protein